ncbi:hypothetical protein ACLB2K_030880 [Fragaria x ananassa]
MTTTAQNAAVSHPELSPSISAPPDSVTAFSPLKRKRPPRIEIPNVLQEIKTEKKHDRFFLICKGQERFRVTDLVRTKPYLVAEVQWLEDRPSGDGEEDLDELATEVESYMKDVIRLSNRLGGKPEKEGGDDVEGKVFETSPPSPRDSRVGTWGLGTMPPTPGYRVKAPLEFYFVPPRDHFPPRDVTGRNRTTQLESEVQRLREQQAAQAASQAAYIAFNVAQAAYVVEIHAIQQAYQQQMFQYMQEFTAAQIHGLPPPPMPPP